MPNGYSHQKEYSSSNDQLLPSQPFSALGMRRLKKMDTFSNSRSEYLKFDWCGKVKPIGIVKALVPLALEVFTASSYARFSY